MWRAVLIAIVLISNAGSVSASTTRQDTAAVPTDLAAIPLTPDGLPETGFQFANGGYLTRADARYFLNSRYDIDSDVVDSVFDATSWSQGYIETLVLLSDRDYRTSEPLASVTTTIHEFETDEGAELLEAMMVGAAPAYADDSEPAVDDGFSWRVASPGDDRLLTIVRAGRFLVEVVSADDNRPPDADDHAAIVRDTIRRARVEEAQREWPISQQMVLTEDSRLVPLAIASENPLVHTWYRLIDGEVVPAAGEIDPPLLDGMPNGLTEVAIARQTASLSSQNWVTVGVVVSEFDTVVSASAFAEGGLMRDPLDLFPASEGANAVKPDTPGMRIETLFGETRVGGKYSGYRITVIEESTVAQLTIRIMGMVRLDQDAVEAWASAQKACMGGGACDDVPLTQLLATPDPATPIAVGTDADRYSSPVASWSISYDPRIWSVEETFAEGGYDYLYLRAQGLEATFETIVDQHGDPEQCLLDQLDRLREEEDRAVITIGSEDDREAPGGLEAEHGWIIYTVEPLEDSRAGDEFTIRIDCYTVLEGSTSLVVRIRAPRSAWSDSEQMAAELRSQIEVQGNPAGMMTDGRLARIPIAGRNVMINRRPWTGIAA